MWVVSNTNTFLKVNNVVWWTAVFRFCFGTRLGVSEYKWSATVSVSLTKWPVPSYLPTRVPTVSKHHHWLTSSQSGSAVRGSNLHETSRSETSVTINDSFCASRHSVETTSKVVSPLAASCSLNVCHYIHKPPLDFHHFSSSLELMKSGGAAENYRELQKASCLKDICEIHEVKLRP